MLARGYPDAEAAQPAHQRGRDRIPRAGDTRPRAPASFRARAVLGVRAAAGREYERRRPATLTATAAASVRTTSCACPRTRTSVTMPRCRWSPSVSSPPSTRARKGRRGWLTTSLRLRRHIDGLSARNYSGIEGLRTPDFVLLSLRGRVHRGQAVPDERLYLHARSARIISVGQPPSTLATLRTVSQHLWRIALPQQQGR